jgi:thioesterase domain-containing protein
MKERSCLVRMNDVQSPVKLFCAHTVTGQTRGYREFAEAVVDMEVFCIEALGMTGEHRPHESMQEMLDHYVPQLLDIQQCGPFFLMGYSSGGILAFELARTLKARRHEVGLLALIDTGIYTERLAPNLSNASFLDRGLWRVFASVLLESTAYLMKYSYLDSRIYERDNPFWDLSEPQKLERLYGLLPAHARSEEWRRATFSDVQDYFFFMKIQWHAVRSHNPDRYAGDVTFFGVSEGNDQLSEQTWRDLTLGKFFVVPMPGDHISIMRGSKARKLGAEISRMAQGALRDAGASNQRIST